MAKVLALQLQHLSFKWIFRLISFKIDWFDLPIVQGTLKSLLQHHSSKTSILWHSAFFMVQLSHPYMTTRKTIALTIWTFVGKVMSLLFNILSGLVIAFLTRSKCLRGHCDCHEVKVRDSDGEKVKKIIGARRCRAPRPWQGFVCTWHEMGSHWKALSKDASEPKASSGFYLTLTRVQIMGWWGARRTNQETTVIPRWGRMGSTEGGKSGWNLNTF